MIPGPAAKVTIAQIRKAFELNTFVVLCVTNATVSPMIRLGEGLIIDAGTVVGTMQVSLRRTGHRKVTTETSGRRHQYDAIEYSVLLAAPHSITRARD
ncbi:hypothetical protein BKA82DRAFT_814389 [Pisolithus tinctorius]|uniref:Uncharacterized protein n=1 Tax=Pisolithus tinctorius Marx 270 TaxID=870435 RepID=A0A0C3NVM6_PISTI|nr:hypothetical protein BKA82DRAFT_814389 [Pisolithus tinctorius]KIN99455.1 hypothetical protein M404DRAFT_814389 [Pisolithus tinctorius Marx 270]